MELNRIDHGEFTEVQASGRLDEHWAEHLSDGLNRVIRDGSHRIRLNMSAISYLSSAGIRVLMTFYKQLGEIGGSFTIVDPSKMVLKVLDLTKLTAMLLGAAPALAAEATPEAGARMERQNAAYEVLDRAGGGFECCVTGDPALLATGGYREEHARTKTFHRDSAGLGLGAFGDGFEDCRQRYGEFLAVAGTAVYLPTDGSGVPDYLVAAEDFVPQVSMLYGLCCEGRFASLTRFEALKQSRAAGLGEIAQSALEIAEADSALMVLIAETAGLVGASLRRPPSTATECIFTHPEIRRWISFTAEPAFGGSLCLVVGVAARKAQSALQPLLRPIGKNTGLTGHFHAAAFPYRPLKKGRIDLNATVNALLGSESVQGMLHLLADDREGAGAGLSGAGESEFVRGALWVGPITKVVSEGA